MAPYRLTCWRAAREHHGERQRIHARGALLLPLLLTAIGSGATRLFLHRTADRLMPAERDRIHALQFEASEADKASASAPRP
jgi:hypothetical protein